MDYKNGKIYKIVDNAYTKMYIGSTTQPLYKRFWYHKGGYKSWIENKKYKNSAYDLFDEFGFENCKIELIENYECNSKEELERKEGEHIKNNECVNKYIAGRSKKERYQDDKDKILEKNNVWKILNKDKYKEQQKEYRQKDIICECGRTYKQGTKSKHIKTNVHNN
jgi:hypothetical protein